MPSQPALIRQFVARAILLAVYVVLYACWVSPARPSVFWPLDWLSPR